MQRLIQSIVIMSMAVLAALASGCNPEHAITDRNAYTLIAKVDVKQEAHRFNPTFEYHGVEANIITTMATDGEGSIVFCDKTNDKLYKFSPSGLCLRAVRHNDPFYILPSSQGDGYFLVTKQGSRPQGGKGPFWNVARLMANLEQAKHFTLDCSKIGLNKSFFHIAVGADHSRKLLAQGPGKDDKSTEKVTVNPPMQTWLYLYDTDGLFQERLDMGILQTKICGFYLVGDRMIVGDATRVLSMTPDAKEQNEIIVDWLREYYSNLGKEAPEINTLRPGPDDTLWIYTTGRRDLDEKKERLFVFNLNGEFLREVTFETQSEELIAEFTIGADGTIYAIYNTEYALYVYGNAAMKQAYRAGRAELEKKLAARAIEIPPEQMGGQAPDETVSEPDEEKELTGDEFYEED